MLSEDRLLPPSAVPHRVVWERPVLALGLRTVGEVLKSVQLGSRHGAGPGGRVLATESRQLRCSSAPSYRTLIWLTRASYVQLDNAEALEYGQHQGTIRSRSLCDGNFGDPAYRSKNLQIKKEKKRCPGWRSLLLSTLKIALAGRTNLAGSIPPWFGRQPRGSLRHGELVRVPLAQLAASRQALPCGRRSIEISDEVGIFCAL